MTAAVVSLNPQEPRQKEGVLVRTGLGVLKLMKYFSPIAIILLIWQLLSTIGVLNPRTVPSPFQIWSAFLDLIFDGVIFRHLISTVIRAETGLILSAIFGIALGLLMARVKVIHELAYPLVALTYTLPKTALIPIVFLWLGVGDASNIFVAFIGAIVPIVISTFHGAEKVETQLVWSAKSFGVSNQRILWSVIFPRALPQILNGLRIAQAFSIVVVISAEMVASYVGIGRYIFLFGEAGNYDYMFAAIATIILAAFLLDQLLLLIRNRLLVWTDDTARES